jgi:hypothetical protein
MEGAPWDKQLRAHARTQVGPYCSYGATAVGVEQQNFEGFAQIVVVELVGAYPVHDDLGIGRDAEVKCRGIGAVAFVGAGQRLSWDFQGASVGFGDESAGRVPLESQHRLDLVCCQTCFNAHCHSPSVFSQGGYLPHHYTLTPEDCGGKETR